MFILNPKTTIANAEGTLRELSQRGLGDEGQVILPHEPSHFQCGGLVANVQAIITWARLRADLERPISFNFRGFEAAQLPGAVEHLPGLVGVLMAGDVVDGAGRSVRSEAMRAAGERIERMSDLEANKRGPAMSLLCADRTSKRALPAFYHPRANGGGVLKDETEFNALARSLLEIVVQVIRYGDVRGLDRSLGVLLRELFDNTHRYARHDTSDEEYRQSVRGVYMAHHGSAPLALERAAEGYRPLEHYLKELESLKPQESSDRAGIQRQFFELSVFDSGPGLAARLNGAPLPAEAGADFEYKLVTDCFRKNVSTANRPGGGIGLSRVLLRLKRGGGFLRLRTGRLSLYRNFFTSYGEKAELGDEDLALEDVEGGPPSLQPWAAGTVLTLLLPLRLPR